jgi:4-oxalocrotonate tautomerase
MPLIHVSLYEGRSIEQKREFVKAVTAETARTLKCPPESVDIIFEDIKKSDWASAGKLASDT